MFPKIFFYTFSIFKLQRFTLKDFDDFQFCSSVIIPYFKVKKNGRLWTVNLAIAKELYEYKYPFQMNEYFLTWKTYGVKCLAKRLAIIIGSIKPSRLKESQSTTKFSEFKLEIFIIFRTYSNNLQNIY